jgi:two-component system NtrC family response regulator
MKNGNILIIDDEEQLRSLIKRILTLEQFTVHEASCLKEGLAILKKGPIDVILCDVKLPDGNGVDFTVWLKEKHPMTEVILLTAFANVPDGVQAMKNGAFDYVRKGDDNDKIIPLLYKALDKVSLEKRVKQLEEQVGKKYSFERIIGESPLIKESIALAQKVSVTDTTVLLLGETGTGKEVFAQAIHNGSKRNMKPFVAINCSSFSKELLESEIFGYKAGAFTGAVHNKKGLIEEAHTGTLFLDEIGEMQFELQAKLLRVLESSEFVKLGDTKSTQVNVRIITATNRNLDEEVKAGKFREDLFYRLNVFSIQLPALRDRAVDIPLLATFYVQIFSTKMNKRIKGLTKETSKILQHHSWKGNIRELKNIIERAVIVENSELITEDSLPFDIRQPSSESYTTFDLAIIEKSHIQKVLIHTKGNKTETARLLNIGLTTLYRKIEEYDLKCNP